MKKKTIASVASIITAVFVVFGGYFYQDENKTAVNRKIGTYSSAQTLEKIEFPNYVFDVSGEGIEPFGYINVTVSKVIDGDTFRAEYKKKEYKVRMLDIDTPESVKSGVDPQPFSGEASDLTKDTLTNKTVKLIFEKDTTDQYGRLLAHVVLEDGSFYNAMMVNGGYAISVFYSPNTLLKSFFDKLQNDAIKEGKGFWELPENQRPYIKNQKGKYVASYKNSK